jgi:glycosyltransferase involved in cell wall biosynthesis
MVLGFLSNITEDKGIFTFFSAVRELELQGHAVKGLIAGPVDSAIEGRFREALQTHASVRHVGPVYGADKKRFLDSIDLLLFPTQYVNEAEPVTIWEAMASGVPVAACCRGCIPSMIQADLNGRTFATPDDLISGLGKWLKRNGDAGTLKRNAQTQFQRNRSNAQVALESLLAEMSEE